MKEIRILSIYKESPFIIAELLIGENHETIKTQINEDFFQYSTTDRIDAYVWGLLIFALQNGYNISSDLPITDELKYNLENHLILPLCHNNEGLNHIKILAPTISPTQKKGHVVATGISCGIDSLYTIQQHTQSDIPETTQINTLSFFNAGAAMKGDNRLRTPLVEGRLQLARKFANEYGFRFLFVESDIHLLIQKYTPYQHAEQHTYMMLFCINLIQPCILRYYYSSGYHYKAFSLNIKDSGLYDLLLMHCASIGNMHFYSSGGNATRPEKTRSLINYIPAQKYLNVCVNEIKNCGTCFKCIRTLLTIDGLGGIKKFNQVFDIDNYKNNRFFYFKRMYLDAKHKSDVYYKEIQPLFENKLSTWLKIRFYASALKNIFKSFFK